MAPAHRPRSNPRDTRPPPPLRPVPWPDTGDHHLDLLRAAVETRLYPHGDFADSTGRVTLSYQASLLAKGLRDGMTDADVATFLSSNLMCGGTPIYRRTPGGLEPAGYVVFSGRYGAADVMGRRPFAWHLSATPAGVGAPTITWNADELYDAFRRAFGIRARVAAPQAPTLAWEAEQGVLF